MDSLQELLRGFVELTLDEKRATASWAVSDSLSPPESQRCADLEDIREPCLTHNSSHDDPPARFRDPPAFPLHSERSYAAVRRPQVVRVCVCEKQLPTRKTMRFWACEAMTPSNPLWLDLAKKYTSARTALLDRTVPQSTGSAVPAVVLISSGELVLEAYDF